MMNKEETTTSLTMEMEPVPHQQELLVLNL